SKVKEQGQDDLFAFDSEEDSNFAGCELVNVPEWNTHQRLLGEKETLGFYLSGHPLERYAAELSHITKQSISALVPMRDKTLMIAGLVVQVRKLQTKNGDPMAILTLEDSSGRVDVTVFSDLYVSSKNLLEKDQILVVQGEASVDNFSGGIRFTARRLWSIEQARMTFSKAIKLTLEKHMISSEFLDKLQGLFQPFKQGKCPIVIEYRCEDATAQLNLSQQWLINPADQLLDHLHTLLGQQQVSVIY
ncbi:MAG: DNA polymerase III subunit alpha, partial [Proteobacteria bacterium]|nr:DNA polymerase III subunit alpha [Pseudomonadota bacterium]